MYHHADIVEYFDAGLDCGLGYYTDLHRHVERNKIHKVLKAKTRRYILIKNLLSIKKQTCTIKICNKLNVPIVRKLSSLGSNQTIYYSRFANKFQNHADLNYFPKSIKTTIDKLPRCVFYNDKVDMVRKAHKTQGFEVMTVDLSFEYDDFLKLNRLNTFGNKLGISSDIYYQLNHTLYHRDEHYAHFSLYKMNQKLMTFCKKYLIESIICAAFSLNCTVEILEEFREVVSDIVCFTFTLKCKSSPFPIEPYCLYNSFKEYNKFVKPEAKTFTQQIWQLGAPPRVGVQIVNAKSQDNHISLTTAWPYTIVEYKDYWRLEGIDFYVNCDTHFYSRVDLAKGLADISEDIKNLIMSTKIYDEIDMEIMDSLYSMEDELAGFYKGVITKPQCCLLQDLKFGYKTAYKILRGTTSPVMGHGEFSFGRVKNLKQLSPYYRSTIEYPTKLTELRTVSKRKFDLIRLAEETTESILKNRNFHDYYFLHYKNLFHQISKMIKFNSYSKFNSLKVYARLIQTEQSESVLREAAKEFMDFFNRKAFVIAGSVVTALDTTLAVKQECLDLIQEFGYTARHYLTHVGGNISRASLTLHKELMHSERRFAIQSKIFKDLRLKYGDSYVKFATENFDYDEHSYLCWLEAQPAEIPKKLTAIPKFVLTTPEFKNLTETKPGKDDAGGIEWEEICSTEAISSETRRHCSHDYVCFVCRRKTKHRPQCKERLRRICLLCGDLKIKKCLKLKRNKKQRSKRQSKYRNFNHDSAIKLQLKKTAEVGDCVHSLRCTACYSSIERMIDDCCEFQVIQCLICDGVIHGRHVNKGCKFNIAPGISYCYDCDLFETQGSFKVDRHFRTNVNIDLNFDEIVANRLKMSTEQLDILGNYYESLDLKHIEAPQIITKK